MGSGGEGKIRVVWFKKDHSSVGGLILDIKNVA